MYNQEAAFDKRFVKEFRDSIHGFLNSFHVGFLEYALRVIWKCNISALLYC